MDILLKLWSHVLWSHVHSTVHVSVIVAVLAQPELILRPNATLMGVRVRPCCTHWACLGPNFGARCSHRTKLRMLSPTCAQTCPSCAMLDPQLGSSWAQVWANWPKWPPVRPNLRPRTAKFDPFGFWLGQVGPLLSSLSCSLGAGGSRREATRINQMN